MPGDVTTGDTKKRAAATRSRRVDRARGVIFGARQVSSPNHDARPAGVAPSLIVIHGISLPPGRFGGPWIERLFTNSLPADRHPYFKSIAGLRVSAHLVIRRGGVYLICRSAAEALDGVEKARESIRFHMRHTYETTL